MNRLLILATSTIDRTNAFLQVSLKYIISTGIVIVLGAALIMLSCSRVLDQRLREGVIEYDVTFPYLDESNNMMASLLPEKMYFHFEENRYSSELSTVGGLFKNRFVSNQNERHLIHQMKIFKK